ncbi:diaminopimelate epimerase [Pseudoxanthomonas kalamensis DSM 18571]|uniref:diaminopimelate epimerase n=1 Tax=Pseudoxanthomonas kalamensis TaxID=289483 RepID=UPI0013915E1B|nr:diaminopimelate epimerase [Pseudoxanthomonas kalamensis]KAF1712035.1 diaminopimelate epimerase [Pseudoxanthomonas kalamensis DSM 18571]
MGLKFDKMHGAGNDFVVLDLRDGAPPPDAALAARLADRHFGVGCDQILTIETPRADGSVASYRIWNADGSNSQQCGNGARCVAAWLVRDGAAVGDAFRIDSPVATHAVQALGDGEYAIELGVPDFAPARIPMSGFAQAQDEYAVVVDGAELCFGAVSMGNPHAVIEVADVASTPVDAIGRRLQGDAIFPESVNVGFAEIVACDHVRLRVYERGVGETLACGSGACAAAAVLMRRGRIGREATISLPGGDLRIRWPADDAQVIMSGPTAFVFEGEFHP